MANPHPIQVIHGPSLNLLGAREPEIYGATSLDENNAELATAAKECDAEIELFQSRYEGALIEHLVSGS